MPYQAPTIIQPNDGVSGFSEVEYADLVKFIKSNIKFTDSKLQNFRDDKLPEMVRLYKGVPKERDVSFPWPGAANLVIQLIGTFSDELLSRIMGSIYQYDPLFFIDILGDSPDLNAMDQKAILEKFLMDEAYDPNALDFYRVEQSFMQSAIKYGTGIMEFPWEYNIEKNYVYTGGGETQESKVTFKFVDITKRDAPHPKLVPLNCFGIDPNIPVMADADFFCTIETMNKWQVKNLRSRSDLYAGISEETWNSILSGPDNTAQKPMQQEVEQALGTEGQDSSEDGSSRWYFHNCYIKYRKGNETFSILAKYHKRSEKLLWAIFNPYPQNIFPVEDVKLAYDDENYFGTGYAMMLRNYQRELSQNSNFRTNNRNFGMLGMLRVDPNSKLSSVLQVYPGVMIPAKDGEVEMIKAGSDVGYNNDADNFIYGCAKDRAGVDPAITGTGGGMVNPKRGIYSASGTSMMLMQQNNRNNLRMSDMRSAHVRIAIKLMQMYSNIGIGARLKKYGSNSEILKKAFDSYKTGSLGFRLRPTTASNNKELERQNDILLAQTMDRFHSTNGQIIQAILQMEQNPQFKPLSEYYQQAIVGSIELFKIILTNFGRGEVTKLLPKVPNFAASSSQGGAQPQGQGALSNGQNSGSNPQAGGAGAPIPTGGVQSSGAIPI